MERFVGTVEPAARAGHVIEVPATVAAAIGAKHMMRVKGSVAGVAYRSNVAMMKGRLILGVHKATLLEAGKGVGDEVEVGIEFDPDER